MRGMRVTVGLLEFGDNLAKILSAYPYLEEEYIKQAFSYATWRAEEIDISARAS
ncbi:DUF433 domain-containing protein [Lacihabitans soyangensis]|uniref:DUF433 domain-containing protein n=1 Tax=Lacihabitans soyangensis TaxID=869394 RepID=UPI00286E228B|nr:DUF433 domain-containing protein [Lacihabitans soyangensis]